MLDSQTKTREKIRISREAWAGTMDKASPGQIVNIELLPTPSFWSRFRRAQSEEPRGRGASAGEESHLLPGSAGSETISNRSNRSLMEKRTDEKDLV